MQNYSVSGSLVCRTSRLPGVIAPSGATCSWCSPIECVGLCPPVSCRMAGTAWRAPPLARCRCERLPNPHTCRHFLRRYFRRALVYAQDMLASRAAQVGMKGVGLLSAVSRHTAKGSVSVGVKPSLWRSRMLSDASECCDLFCTRARVVFGGFSHLLAHHRRRHHRTTPDVALGFVLGAMPHRACAGSRVRGAAELLGCIQQEQQARVYGGMSFVVRSTCADAHAEICFVVCSCSQVPPACIHDYGATVRCSAGLC